MAALAISSVFISFSEFYIHLAAFGLIFTDLSLVFGGLWNRVSGDRFPRLTFQKNVDAGELARRLENAAKVDAAAIIQNSVFPAAGESA